MNNQDTGKKHFKRLEKAILEVGQYLDSLTDEEFEAELNKFSIEEAEDELKGFAHPFEEELKRSVAKSSSIKPEEP